MTKKEEAELAQKIHNELIQKLLDIGVMYDDPFEKRILFFDLLGQTTVPFKNKQT